jgi:uncharacterized membrane protein YoaT (DUF817 family)
VAIAILAQHTRLAILVQVPLVVVIAMERVAAELLPVLPLDLALLGRPFRRAAAARTLLQTHLLGLLLQLQHVVMEPWTAGKLVMVASNALLLAGVPQG